MKRTFIWALIITLILDVSLIAALQQSDVPGKITFVHPLDDPQNPVFGWTAAAGALTYELYIQSVNGTLMTFDYNQTVCAADRCTAAPEFPLAAGAFVAWVRATNAVGYGEWSDPLRFRVPITPPRLIEPVGTVTTAGTFSWVVAPGAQWYQIQVEIAPNVTYDHWYDQANICDQMRCTATIEIDLGEGQFRWQVRSFVMTQSDNLYSEWSDMLDFMVVTS